MLIDALSDLPSEALATRDTDIVVGLRRVAHHDLVAHSIGYQLINEQVLPEYVARLIEHAGQAQVGLPRRNMG